MADFKTHITVSTALGVAYGGGAYLQFDVPAESCILAGALCSVSGMLPDLDSDSGVPLRESLAFASACIPMLLFHRLQQAHWSTETIALAGAALYGAIRFGIGKLLKKYTVHRGMFHSIPAALIAGELAFLLCSYGSEYIRFFKAGAVLLGFLSHLVLDEIWSVQVKRGMIGLKSSSGTALKLWSGSLWANLSTYGKLAILSVLVFKDPMWSNYSPELARLHEAATKVSEPMKLEQGLQLLKGKQLSPSDTGVAAPATHGQPAQRTAPATENRAPAVATSTNGNPTGTNTLEGTFAPPASYATIRRATASSVQPSYTQPGYAPPGYRQPTYSQPTYTQPGYTQPSYAQPGYGAPGYAPSGYATPGYPMPGYGGQPYPQPSAGGVPVPMGVGPGMSQPRY